MTNLEVSSTDSSSGSTSDSSSSGSSSSSSESGSSSSDSESSTSETQQISNGPVAPKTPTKQPISEEPVSTTKPKEEKSRRSSTKVKPSSSSEEEVPAKAAPKPIPARRRSSAKPKTTATITPKQSKPAPRPPPGGKTPKPTSKTMPKPAVKAETRAALKKKSIFSPDNSSESEPDDTKNKTTYSKAPPKAVTPAAAARNKGRSRKPSGDKTKVLLTVDKKDEKPTKDTAKRRSGSRSNGPPSKKTAEDKESVSSCTSSQSSADSDTAESDSEQSPKKEPEVKTGKTKPPPTMVKTKTKIADTPPKIAEPEPAREAIMPRKLTRSLSARASRLAAATRVTHTDTDSEADDKTSEKNMDMKKGRRVPRSPAAAPLPAPVEPAEPQERRCPVRGCDSKGHLGGSDEKHFTWDACPVYHNVTPAWCVAAAEERASATVARRRALHAMAQRPRAQPTIEQRAYQLKVKDLRSKWKGSSEFREKNSTTVEEINEEREPQLEGFAPDYDLRLFREAQALAAIKIEKELGDLPSDKGTKYVVMGKYMMEVWYQSPYPGDAARAPRLYICEFCLAHHKSQTGATRHAAKCVWRHPPGDEVYRKSNLSVWQVDGRKHKQYCQQLCLLAKFFLDHKTLYYDVEPFLFYVMTVSDHEGCHILGYFSKEKNSFLNYNVSCILTLPPYQRQGYGRLLIDFSYLLTKVEGKVGSPETPLSDLGLISYRSYWKEALLKRLCSAPGPTLCIRDLSKDLAIASCDIVSTLQERGLMKYWKGKHIVLKKQEVLEDVSRRSERTRCVEPSCLRWTPPAAPPPR